MCMGDVIAQVLEKRTDKKGLDLNRTVRFGTLCSKAPKVEIFPPDDQLPFSRLSVPIEPLKRPFVSSNRLFGSSFELSGPSAIQLV